MRLEVRGVNGVTVQVSMCDGSLKITELGRFRAQVADHSLVGDSR